jgi:proline dehydrogenase
MRSLFLWLSRSRALKNWTARSRLAQIASRRFVAGESADQAISTIRAFNSQGIAVTLDHLGENTETEAQALDAADEYIHVLGRIGQGGVDSSVSVKLTQLGLDLSFELCLDNVTRIAAQAEQVGTFVRIDMESSDYVQSTLDLLRAVRTSHSNVAIVLQTYLYRTRADVEAMIAAGVPVRLCKGAYDEPATVAFPNKSDVDNNMIDLMQIFFSPGARENGAQLALATHDDKMIAAMQAYTAWHDIPPETYEFQMLYGIRPDRQRELARQGYRMRVYVPYGSEWYPYYMRRLAERPANVWFVLSNMLRR